MSIKKCTPRMIFFNEKNRKIHIVLDMKNRIWKSDNCKLLRTRSSLYFEFLVSNKNYSGKLVTDNWFKIHRHLPMCGINVTSECKRNMRNTISVDSLFRQEYFYPPLSSVLFLVRLYVLAMLAYLYFGKKHFE